MKVRKIVVDASYILDILFPDEKIQRLPKEKMIAPTLLEYEVVNAIKMGVVRKRITESVGQELIKEWLEWKIEYHNIDVAAVMRLALATHLSVYDASYLWLAKEQGVGLLTWDKRLMGVARQVV